MISDVISTSAIFLDYFMTLHYPDYTVLNGSVTDKLEGKNLGQDSWGPS
jgi:hypothetical protein